LRLGLNVADRFALPGEIEIHRDNDRCLPCVDKFLWVAVLAVAVVIVNINISKEQPQ
jgi:hypothetical protein